MYNQTSLNPHSELYSISFPKLLISTCVAGSLLLKYARDNIDSGVHFLALLLLTMGKVFPPKQFKTILRRLRLFLSHKDYRYYNTKPNHVILSHNCLYRSGHPLYHSDRCSLRT